MHESAVCAKILRRAEVGKNKYGGTMERTDLELVEWMKHLQEEMMDATVYLERLISDLDPENRHKEAKR